MGGIKAYFLIPQLQNRIAPRDLFPTDDSASCRAVTAREMIKFLNDLWEFMLLVSNSESRDFHRGAEIGKEFCHRVKYPCMSTDRGGIL